LDQRISDRRLVNDGTFDWQRFVDLSVSSLPTSNAQDSMLLKLGYLSRLSSRAENFYGSGISGVIETDPTKMAMQIATFRKDPNGKDINCNSINNFLLPPLAEALGFTTRKHSGMWVNNFKPGQHYIRTYELHGDYAAVNYDEIALLGHYSGASATRNIAVARATQETLGPALGFYLGNQHFYTRNGALLLDTIARDGVGFSSLGDGSRTFQLAYHAFRYAHLTTPEGNVDTFGAHTRPGTRWKAYGGYVGMESTSPYPIYVLRISGGPASGAPPVYTATVDRDRHFATHGALVAVDYASRFRSLPGVQSAVRANTYAYEDLKGVKGIRDFDARAPNFGSELAVKTLFGGGHTAVDLYTPAWASASEGRAAFYYSRTTPDLGKREEEVPRNEASHPWELSQVKAGAIIGRPISGERFALCPALSAGAAYRQSGLTAQVTAQYLNQGQGTLRKGGSVQFAVDGTIFRGTQVTASYTIGGGAYGDPFNLRNTVRPQFNEPGRLQLLVQQKL
jgi:hypothetical protein